MAISRYTHRSYSGTCIFQPKLGIIVRCIAEIICMFLIELYDSYMIVVIIKPSTFKSFFKCDNSAETGDCVFSFILLFYVKRYYFLTKIIFEYYLQALQKGFPSLF